MAEQPFLNSAPGLSLVSKMDPVPERTRKGTDLTAAGAPTEVLAVEVSMEFLFVLDALVSENGLQCLFWLGVRS